MSFEIRAALLMFFLLALIPVIDQGYVVYILPQYMLYGVLALTLGLLWGGAGILSFGQGAFFAIGAYVMGHAMSAGFPFGGGYTGLVIAAVINGLIAGLAGYFLFSAYVRATYFVLITLALSIIAEQIAVSLSWLTGGYDGMFVNRMPLFPWFSEEMPGDVPLYFFILVVTALCYFFMHWLKISRFGKILAGIRENEDRLTALGFKIHLYKTAAFAISGAVAGFAGALYGTSAGFVSPPMAGVLFSTQVVVWVAIGGRKSLLGAFIGSVIVAALSNYLSSFIPDYWQLFLGLIFIFVIMFLRDGLLGGLETVATRWKKG